MPLFLRSTFSVVALTALVACSSSSVPNVDSDSADPVTVVAVDDNFTVASNSSNNELAVLGNDSPQGAVSIQSVEDPDGAGGSVVTTDGNVLRYTPDPNFSGGEVDSFSYVITDGNGNSDTGLVRVAISATLVAVDDAFDITAGSSNNRLDVLANDSGPAPLTIVSVTDPDGAGPSTVTIDNGRIVYNPDQALAAGATESFEYVAEDANGEQDTATVSITLIAGPSANDDNLTINKNSPHNVIDVLDNDTAEIAANKAIDSFDQATAQGGRVFLNGDGSQLIYQPPRNFPAQSSPQGADSFNYTMTDGTATASATVNITINQHVNQQGRPCEEQAENRMTEGRPFCFDVGIPADTGDGHMIFATVYVPADQGASLPPVMLHAHGFGESRFASLENPNSFMVNRVTAQSLLDLWHEGYWVVSYDQRGFNASNLWGNSADSSNGQCNQDGDPECIDVLNPEREGRDMVTVTDWIVENLRQGFAVTVGQDGNTSFTAPADPNAPALFAEDFADDPVMGTIGLSYGGGYQTIGTSVENALNGLSRVNAMVPVTTWFDIRYSLSPADVPKSGWIQFLTAASNAGGTSPAPDGLLANAGQEALVADNISDTTYDRLFLRTPRAYCEGLGDGTIDGNPLEPASTGNGVTNQLAAVPNVFIIQGQRDLLFNYNEALDLAKCYEAAGSTDVRLLIQTEGHILGTAQPASYKGETEVIYIDEEVFCDVDGNTPLDTTALITGWLRSILPPPNVLEQSGIVGPQPPKMCTTHFLPGAAPLTGNTFASFADVPVGGSVTVNLDGDAGTAGDQDVSITLPGGGPNSALHQQTLLTAAGDVVISGVPTMQLSVTGTGSPAGDDARFFAVLGVIRNGSNTVDRIADQITPVSGPAPSASQACAPPAQGCPISFTYPRANGHYPEQVGETIGTMVGVAVKLNDGDQLVLQFFDQTQLFNLHGTQQGGYNLSVSGSVSIPVVTP